MPVIEIDGDVPDEQAIQIAQRQMGQQQQQQNPFQQLAEALSPVLQNGSTASATPTLPKISGGDVAGLGLQGTQQLQGQAQQSIQDQVMQRERQRIAQERQLEAAKDRAQQLKVQQQDYKNRMAENALRIQQAKDLAKMESSLRIEEGEKDGTTDYRKAQLKALEEQQKRLPPLTWEERQRDIQTQLEQEKLKSAKTQNQFAPQQLQAEVDYTKAQTQKASAAPEQKLTQFIDKEGNIWTRGVGDSTAQPLTDAQGNQLQGQVKPQGGGAGALTAGQRINLAQEARQQVMEITGGQIEQRDEAGNIMKDEKGRNIMRALTPEEIDMAVADALDEMERGAATIGDGGARTQQQGAQAERRQVRVTNPKSAYFGKTGTFDGQYFYPDE